VRTQRRVFTNDDICLHSPENFAAKRAGKGDTALEPVPSARAAARKSKQIEAKRGKAQPKRRKRNHSWGKRRYAAPA
jgi:hypothetical protein